MRSLRLPERAGEEERAWPMREMTWAVMWLAIVVAVGCGVRQPAEANPFPSEDPPAGPTSAPVTLIEVGPSTQSNPQPANPSEPAAENTADVPPPTTQPADAESATTEPASTQPASGPAPAETATTEPATTEPATTEPATTEPATTEPATTAPVETPRQVLAGVMNATFRGDADGVARRLHVAGENSQRLADAMVDVARAAAKVHEAAVARFGEEEARKLGVDVVPPVVIASAMEHIEADRATVKLQGQNGGGVVFQKIDGAWKMSLPELISQQTEGRSIDQLVNDTRSPVGRFEDLARRVNDGQFESAEQVLAELAQTFFSAQQGK